MQMGFNLFGIGKKEEGKEEPKEAKPSDSSEGAEGKYSEACALCGKAPSEKKWMGKYWHKSCIRKSRKFAKGMF